MLSSRPAIRDYGLLALFVAIAYWPLSSMHHMTKWDSIETYFPFRYFLSDCLRNGTFPFWNPYQLGGYPFYGDPQSGAWYPLAWLFCVPGPYNFMLFRLEYLVTILIAALGMYELIRSFQLSRPIALIAAIAYSSCGFFVSNAEHLTWIISAAWLPWIFWSYHRLYLTGRIDYALLVAMFLFLLLTGGYPAFFIVTCYLLLLFFVCSPLNQPHSFRKIVGLHLIAGFVFLALSAAAMLSWYQALSLSNRSGPMTVAAMNVNPFSPRCLFSLLLPFETLKDDAYFKTDLSMRNAYIGLLSLLAIPFAWSSILQKRRLILIIVLTVICLAAAFGDYLPLRHFLYRHVPLMDLFRFPALFRIYFMIGLIVVATHGLSIIIAGWPAYRRKFQLSVLALMLVFATLLLCSIMRHGWSWNWGLFGSRFEAHQFLSTRHENLQLQSILQLLLLGSLFAVTFFQKQKLPAGLLILFCATDMMAATAMNAFSTIVSIERSPNIERPLAHAPHGFPVPDNSRPVSDWTDARRALPELRTNTGIYFKTPDAGGYNSFTLRSSTRFENSAIHDSVLANPYLYFAGAISYGPDEFPLRRKDEIRIGPDFEKPARASRYLLDADANRTLSVLTFTPNKIKAVVHSDVTAFLNLQQNHVEGWKAYLDGREIPIVTTNYTQIGVNIPAGRHQLEWQFNPPLIKTFAALSLATLTALVTALLGFRKRLFAMNFRG